MKIGFSLMFLTFLISCTNSEYVFDEIECSSNFIEPKLGYDRIYNNCKQFIFQAKYWDADYNLISDQRIWMMATGKRWEYDEGQAELYIQYEYDEAEVERIKSFGINNKLADRIWMKSETTGFGESESGLWFHPFRSNQYLFTEVAPFPMVTYDKLDIGTSWSRALNIHEGWGDWSDSRIENSYYVAEVVKLDTEIGVLDSCYHISSVGKANFGNSTFDYWFNKEYGIVKMLYRNYKSQILQIELIQVKNG